MINLVFFLISFIVSEYLHTIESYFFFIFFEERKSGEHSMLLILANNLEAFPFKLLTFFSNFLISLVFF